MTRRLFFLAALASVGAALGARPAQAPCHVFCRLEARWVPVHRRLIRAGDEVWIEGDGVYLCCGSAEPDAIGNWTFRVCEKIDPATNTWHPL